MPGNPDRPMGHVNNITGLFVGLIVVGILLIVAGLTGYALYQLAIFLFTAVSLRTLGIAAILATLVVIGLHKHRVTP